VFDGIDPRRPTPLYEQIAARVRVAVASGQLSPGDALPSVRSLAGELRINPATVAQAYRELATDGFVEKRHGQGTFINELPVMTREDERRRRAIEIARTALTEATRLGLTGEEVLDAVADQVHADESASAEVGS
jgi:GntR family transcriptional regulator